MQELRKLPLLVGEINYKVDRQKQLTTRSDTPAVGYHIDRLITRRVILITVA